MKITDTQIEKLESKGFNRWQKNNMDRLYINVESLGLEIESYNSGNIRSAYWQGQKVSNSNGRRLISSKVWLNVETGELHVKTSYEPNYGEDDLELETVAKNYVTEILEEEK